MGAEEMSVFHKLPLLKGTKPARPAVCPAFITLQARLPPPVPPPDPPLPPPEPPEPPPGLVLLTRDTPEQAISESEIAASAETKRSTLQNERRTSILQLFSARGYARKKRP